jgi:hypothetical protein
MAIAQLGSASPSMPPSPPTRARRLSPRHTTPAGALHGAGHLGHQLLVVVARGAVLHQRLLQQLQAGVGHAHRLAALRVLLALQQAGGQQLHLQQVLVGASRPNATPHAGGGGGRRRWSAAAVQGQAWPQA